MLKTTRSFVASTFSVDNNKVVSCNCSIGASGRNVSGSNASRKMTMSKSQTKNRHLEETKFLTFGVRKTFNHLKQAFTKGLILQHFDLECHIRIKTNASSYALRRVLSQLIKNQVTSDETIKSSVD